MNKPSHHFSDLFAQLGLPNDNRSIAQFLSNYTGRSQGVRLPDAPFWTRSQAAFLRESLSQDSDWSGLVDQLSKALRDTAGQPPQWQAFSPVAAGVVNNLTAHRAAGGTACPAPDWACATADRPENDGAAIGQTNQTARPGPPPLVPPVARPGR